MDTKSSILKKSYDRLFISIKDTSNYMELANNAWNEIYFELFKNILAMPEISILCDDAEVDTRLKRNTFITRVLNKAINKTNDFIDTTKIFSMVDKTRNNQSPEIPTPEITDYVDYDPPSGAWTRLTNPTARDLLPRLKVSQEGFCETDALENSGIYFPHNKIPYITIYPSPSGIYNFNKMYSTYIYSKDNHYFGSILEISVNSLIADIANLIEFYDFTNQTLNPEGELTLRNLILKYTEFTLPLLIINLRKDYRQYNVFLNNIFSSFNKTYPIEVNFQRHFYTLLNELLKSKLGIFIANIHVSTFSTSTIELLDSNSNYTPIIKELAEVTDCRYGTEYIARINDIYLSDFKDIVGKYYASRKEYKDFIKTVTNRILLHISNYIAFPSTQKGSFHELIGFLNQISMGLNEQLKKSLDVKLNGEEKFLIEGPQAIEIIGNSLNELRKEDEIMNTLNKIAVKTSSQSYNKIKGASERPNQKMDGPYVYSNEIKLRKLEMINNKDIIVEDSEILTDIVLKGNSGRAVHWLKNRLNNVQRFEDAMGIKLDCITYLEFLKLSKVSNESKLPFSNAILNINQYATEKINEYILDEDEMMME